MLPKNAVLVCAVLALLAGCAPAAPSLAPTAVPTPPTLGPSPTATATPIPPLTLTILWPERVSALEPVPIAVKLVPPPGVHVLAGVRATLYDPQGVPTQFVLTRREGYVYASDELLQLPLEPPDGDYRLVARVLTVLDVGGEAELVFRPAAVRFHDLTGVLPAGVDVHVPQAFMEVTAQGDQWAGGRVWRYGGGEVALWWAPGPTEPLLLSNAVVMAEATYGMDTPVVQSAEETEWQGWRAFLFREEWAGADGGPAEALVVQRSDLWLYVLRVRALGDDEIPPLMRQVGETLSFVEEQRRATNHSDSKMWMGVPTLRSLRMKSSS